MITPSASMAWRLSNPPNLDREGAIYARAFPPVNLGQTTRTMSYCRFTLFAPDN